MREQVNNRVEWGFAIGLFIVGLVLVCAMDLPFWCTFLVGMVVGLPIAVKLYCL
jgi:hypothetical protein